jgi:prepilin-type N-terminal cleavage/methylation domain-containing protein
MRMVHLRGRHVEGFTLIELLVAIVIVAVLIGLLIPTLGLVRDKVRRQEARQVVSQLVAALRTYQHTDLRHRYPLELYLYPTPSIGTPQPIAREPQGGAVAGVLRLLIDQHLGVATTGRADEQGRLLDPWGQPYWYQLTRPTPAAPVGVLDDWNREDAPAPYPYVWSTGSERSASDAATWIYEVNH